MAQAGTGSSTPAPSVPPAQRPTPPPSQVMDGFTPASGGTAPYGQAPYGQGGGQPYGQGGNGTYGQTPPNAYQAPRYASGQQPSPQSPQPSQQAPRKRPAGKIVAIALGVVALLAVLGVGGFFAYQTVFGEKPEEIIAAHANELMAAYADPASGEGSALIDEADSILAALGNYHHPGSDAYEAWLDDSSYEVGGVTVSEDGTTATVDVTVTHRPLIDSVEEHEGVRDSAGDEQEREFVLSYRRSGDEWRLDDEAEAKAAVYAAYLPTDEELIISDVYWYLGDPDEVDGQIIAALQESGDQSFEALGITMDEFLDAYLDGFGYEVGDANVDGDVATVRVTVTVKPYDDIVLEFQNQFQLMMQNVDPATITSEEELYEASGQLLLQVVEGIPTQNYTVELVFVQDGDGVWWMDEASHYALMGIFGG